MALQKQPININFAQGVDTKSDPYQIPVGKFSSLKNSVFSTTGRLTKRNGFSKVSTLPNTNQTNLTTLNDNLIATGSDLYAFSQETNQWLNQGSIQPVDLDVLSLVRVSTSQADQDAAVASSGVTCTAYVDSSAVYYQISDSTTGQQIVPRTALTNGVAAPRVFILGRYFIITFISTITAVDHLQYVAIPISVPNNPGTIQTISSTIPSTTIGYDGFVANNSLYIAYSDTASDMKLTFLSSTLILQSAVTIDSSFDATLISVTADETGSTPVIWVSYWGSNDGYVVAYSSSLTRILAPTHFIISAAIRQITSLASSGVLTVFYENSNNYNTTGAYPVSNIRTDYITTNTISVGGTVGTAAVILRSVGLASKAFYGPNDQIYMIATYGESNQPTYFLIDSSGKIYMRLAYSNGGGYKANQVLPSVYQLDGTYIVSYLIKDFLATVNKGTALPSGTPTNAIYTQTGINLAKFTINDSNQYSSEIAGALHLTGGQLWEYDGVKPVEHGFHVWPENVQVTTSGSGGSITAQDYFYVFTYEWTDNQGMLHRSAPSIPFKITTTGASSTNTCYVPTLRLTYKTSPNPVRIVGYRYSTAQPVYYQFTSITSPTANNPAVDYVTITDTQADSTILGQTLLYTTGGVIENICAPASIASCLFKNRLFLVDAEDRNLIWYSKQVIEGVPVEMSDLLTLFVAPTSGAQGSTGPVTALSAMDDKLIIFKRDAIYYLTGIGPDNTGANNDFTDPVFITSSVGCDNPNSIVLMPQGIMFQSDKGIWLLGRDLQTTYIGADVEAYNSQPVQSAEAIPGTNQVRFIVDNSTTLMYDYYFNQWGTFSNIRAISACLYQGAHTYLNSLGSVFQETPGTYVDGSSPVLMSFVTSWINVAGLQGYERFYFMYLLGTYITPYKLNVQLAYDYNPSPSQAVLVTPDNNSPNWGGDPVWGASQSWGGPGNVFEARVFPEKQKCESFQVSVNEIYDASMGVAAGAGLTLSGLNLVVGVKKGYRTQSARRSFG